MDQSRLEELKRLLQKRHEEPKRGLEQNSDGENSGTSNLGVSNFKAQNSEISNFESLNSKAPNFATDALNLESETDLNSTRENSMEPQNFISDDSGSFQHNPKARDYDKDPIILENYEYLYQKLLMVFSLFIGGVFAIIVNFDWKASGAVDYSARTVYT